jgi:hypothetical protein
MHANHREERDEVYAGDIAAAIGLKNVKTGDTLCDKDHPIILEAMKFPEPVISVAIEPKTKADQDKLSAGLAKLSEEDPTFRVYTDEETGQVIIQGMGELHLEIIVDRLRREFKVEANIGRPQVAYRETIRKAADKVEARFVRQTGGRGQYGHVVINIGPSEPGAGFVFEDKIVGGVIPREYIGPVEQGMKEAMATGVLAGYPLIDIRVELIDGSYHDVDSSEMAFKIAGLHGPEGGREEGRRGAAGAHHGRGGGHARRSTWATSWATCRAGAARSGDDAAGGGPGHRGQRAAGGDVRLLHHAALADAGPGRLFHAVLPVRGSAAERRPKRSSRRSTDREDRQWARRSSSGRSRT